MNQGGSSSWCFIATAAYGTPLASEVVVLQKFRDKYLLSTPIGKSFVDYYYKNSPSIAQYIARHESLRSVTRTLLWPLIHAIKHPLQTVAFLLFIAAFFGALIHRRRCRQKMLRAAE